MSITDDERTAIVDYRLERCSSALEEAEQLMHLGMYNVCANRLYYAAFYAASALLISYGIGANSHSGVRAMLHLHFVKPGLLAKDDVQVLMKAFSLRQQCDYDDFIDASKEDLEPMLPSINTLIEKMRRLIK